MCPKESQRTRGEKRSSLVRGSFVPRPWFARLSSVVRSSLGRGSHVSRPWFADKHRGWIGELLYSLFNH